MPDPFAPAKLGPLTLRNRIIKAATFEGATPKRVVTDRLIDFHRRQPDLVRQMQVDRSVEATCIHCNKCMPTIYTGTRCALDQPMPSRVLSS